MCIRANLWRETVAYPGTIVWFGSLVFPSQWSAMYWSVFGLAVEIYPCGALQYWYFDQDTLSALRIHPKWKHWAELVSIRDSVRTGDCVIPHNLRGMCLRSRLKVASVSSCSFDAFEAGQVVVSGTTCWQYGETSGLGGFNSCLYLRQRGYLVHDVDV